MPTATRRKAPAQYHRRLGLLAVAVAVIVIGLLVQAVRLTLVQGDRHLQVAQSRLQSTQWLPTWRGALLDRNGRVLAQDEPRLEAAVAFDAVTGQWAEDRAAASARTEMGREAWAMASPEVRAAAIAARRPAEDVALAALWTAISRATDQPSEAIATQLNEIRGRVQRMSAVVWDQQRRRHEARFGEGSLRSFKPRPIREQVGTHVIAEDLTDTQAARLEPIAAAHPELLELRYARHRTHPWRDFELELDRSTWPGPLRQDAMQQVRVHDPAASLLGTVRDDVWEEDLERRPFELGDGQVDRGGYRDVDVVGASGLERSFEDTLRGDVGLVVRDRDAGETQRDPPVGGGDVVLTIDVLLQARLEAVLDPAVGLTVSQPWHGGDLLSAGTELPASAVVLEVATGEILAMAGTPGPGALARLSDADAAALQPWLIRAAQVSAPPGSIVKPLVLAAAMGAGIIEADTVLTCRGHHFEDHPGMARCWVYRPRYGMATHGSLGAVEALARSCNCWFYELGERLGLEALSEWLASFGLGAPLDIGLTPPWEDALVEVAGARPDREIIEALRRRGEDTFEAVMLGIGQGRTAWTPLHAADAYATLARAGKRIAPTLVRGRKHTSPPPAIPIPREAVNVAIAGLRDVVEQPYGTGHHLTWPEGREPVFRTEGVAIAAKTGTAQAPPWRRDVDGDGVIAEGESVSGLEHAWVVALLGDQGDVWKYAIAVLVEYGGSGGRAAGPIADQVVRALQDTGYLAGGSP